MANYFSFVVFGTIHISSLYCYISPREKQHWCQYCGNNTVIGNSEKLFLRNVRVISFPQFPEVSVYGDVMFSSQMLLLIIKNWKQIINLEID